MSDLPEIPQSIFPRDEYTYYDAEVHFFDICGPTASDPRVIEAWLRKKMGEEKDEEIARLIVQTMEERGCGRAEAEREVLDTSKLSGFKIHSPEHCFRCGRGAPCHDADWKGLCFECRSIKSAIKEAANSVWPNRGATEGRKWGLSKKGTLSFFAEHVQVLHDRVPFYRDDGIVQARDDVLQGFVHTGRHNGIKYEEVLYDVRLAFVVEVSQIGEAAISKKDWATLWKHGEGLGMGGSRSQGHGRYVTTRWERRTGGT